MHFVLNCSYLLIAISFPDDKMTKFYDDVGDLLLKTFYWESTKPINRTELRVCDFSTEKTTDKTWGPCPSLNTIRVYATIEGLQFLTRKSLSQDTTRQQQQTRRITYDFSSLDSRGGTRSRTRKVNSIQYTNTQQTYIHGWRDAICEAHSLSHTLLRGSQKPLIYTLRGFRPRDSPLLLSVLLFPFGRTCFL